MLRTSKKLDLFKCIKFQNLFCKTSKKLQPVSHYQMRNFRSKFEATNSRETSKLYLWPFSFFSNSQDLDFHTQIVPSSLPLNKCVVPQNSKLVMLPDNKSKIKEELTFILIQSKGKVKQILSKKYNKVSKSFTCLFHQSAYFNMLFEVE